MKQTTNFNISVPELGDRPDITQVSNAIQDLENAIAGTLEIMKASITGTKLTLTSSSRATKRIRYYDGLSIGFVAPVQIAANAIKTVVVDELPAQPISIPYLINAGEETFIHYGADGFAAGKFTVPKSNAVDSNATDICATSKAAKTAYDKGVEALTAANSAKDHANTKVSKSGDTMSGSLALTNPASKVSVANAKNGDTSLEGSVNTSENAYLGGVSTKWYDKNAGYGFWRDAGEDIEFWGVQKDGLRHVAYNFGTKAFSINGTVHGGSGITTDGGISLRMDYAINFNQDNSGVGWIMSASSDNYNALTITRTTNGLADYEHMFFYPDRMEMRSQLFNTTDIISRGKMFANSGGYNNTEPVISLAIGDHDTGFNWVSDGTVQIWANGAARGYWNSTELSYNGNIISGQNVVAFSDIKIKKDLEVIPNAIEKICELNGYTYTRKDTGERHCGVVAQEVQKVLPEVIFSSKDSNGEDTLGVAYGNMVGLLIQGMKEQQEIIKSLEKRIANLEVK